MKKKKAQNPQKALTQPVLDVAEDSQKQSTTTSQNAPNAEIKEPSLSQNNSPRTTEAEPRSTATIIEKDAIDRKSQPQPQISEEDRKALENLATAIGIPQLVTEIKKQREEINMIMTTLGGKSPAAGGPLALPGAAAGFFKPIMDKAPELIDGILKWVTQGGQPQQPTQISGIDKEIMEAAIKQTIEIKQKVAAANEALARIYMGGGSVMVDGDGNAVILKPPAGGRPASPKQKEEGKKE